MKGKTIFIIGVVVVVIVGLFVWGNSLQKQNLTTFKDTDIFCLPRGHERLAAHIHPTLSITVDGVEEVIPADVGIAPTCMSEVHTHDATGTLHVESSLPGRVGTLTLADFFAVWERDINRNGFDLTILQDGQERATAEEVFFRDLSAIELVYMSKG